MIELYPNKPGQRFREALAIQEGACNPTAIARALVVAIYEMREGIGADTDAITSDPAIRLIVHQLSFICHTAVIDDSLTVYESLVNACKKGVTP